MLTQVKWAIGSSSKTLKQVKWAIGSRTEML